MRVLHVSNHATLRCGVAEFGRQLSAAVRAAGHDVTDFEGSYPECARRGYFPEDWYTYDVVHLNWQPNTLNHYQPEVLQQYAEKVPWQVDEYGAWPALSVFLHDLPPWSVCALAQLPNPIRSALEPYEDYIVIPPPCLPPRPALPLFERPTIGMTGIINPHVEVVRGICERHGWDLGLSSPEWVSNDEEIARLQRCWVNVVWYDYDRSRSSSASIVATAQRPTVLSYCTRFDHFLPWEGEFYWADPSHPERLEHLLTRLVEHTRRGDHMTFPEASVNALQWPRLIRPLLHAWEGRR